jgi:hypothetical protein
MADDGGDLWDDLINEGRGFLDGSSADESFADTLHELYRLDPELAREAIYEMSDDGRERHELWTAMLYE